MLESWYSVQWRSTHVYAAPLTAYETDKKLFFPCKKPISCDKQNILYKHYKEWWKEIVLRDTIKKYAIIQLHASLRGEQQKGFLFFLSGAIQHIYKTKQRQKHRHEVSPLISLTRNTIRASGANQKLRRKQWEYNTVVQRLCKHIYYCTVHITNTVEQLCLVILPELMHKGPTHLTSLCLKCCKSHLTPAHQQGALETAKTNCFSD